MAIRFCSLNIQFNCRKGLTLVEILVVCLIFGLLSVALFKFFINIVNTAKRAESQIQVYQNQNFILENLPISLKNCIPVKTDGIPDTTAYFGSISNKYIDFYSHPDAKFISDLSVPVSALSQSSFIRFVSLSPTVNDDKLSTIYNFSFGIGNDKYLSESSNSDIIEHRKKMRLFRSCLSEDIDGRLQSSDSLNADSYPYYLRDYCANITCLNMKYFNPVTLTWVSGDWSETYLPAAVEISVIAADDIKKIGDSTKIGSGLKKSVIVSIPCSNLE
ncbi:type II secretion system protein [Candidatus Dependentiae bacterium]|nr:type II secretion system protein [Candidatus Dependentiae bacterium]